MSGLAVKSLLQQVFTKLQGHVTALALLALLSHGGMLTFRSGQIKSHLLPPVSWISPAFAVRTHSFRQAAAVKLGRGKTREGVKDRVR